MITKPRGFSAMTPELQRSIASKGGKAAHVMGKAHEFTSEEAKLAGTKGGSTIALNREHMVKIGRKGGQTAAANRKIKKARNFTLGVESVLSAAESRGVNEILKETP